MTILFKSTTGITDHTVQLRLLTGQTQGSAFALPEIVAGAGIYGATPPGGTPANVYLATVLRGTTLVGSAVYEWDGTGEVTNTALKVAIAANGGGISAGPLGNGLDFFDTTNSLRYIDNELPGGITMTATISSMTSNRASVTVQLSRVAGGFAGNLPTDLAADIYAIRYRSSDNLIDAYDEIQTTLTPLGARIERVVTLVEADEVRIANTYRKLQRGTTQVLLEKQRTISGNTVELRE
jgi:hypothetical protein